MHFKLKSTVSLEIFQRTRYCCAKLCFTVQFTASIQCKIVMDYDYEVISHLTKSNSDLTLHECGHELVDAQKTLQTQIPTRTHTDTKYAHTHFRRDNIFHANPYMCIRLNAMAAQPEVAHILLAFFIKYELKSLFIYASYFSL